MFALGLILTTMSIWTPSVRIEGRQAEGFVGIRDGDRLAHVVLEDRERGELAQGEIGPGDPRWDLPPWAVVPSNSQFAADEVFLAKVRIPKDASYWRLRYETASGRRGFSPWVDECGEIETEAWQRRIDAAHAAGGGVVEVPAGRHRTGGLFLKSNVELRLAKGAVLEGVADIGRYRGMKLPYVEVDEPWTAVIGAQGATNVAVTGEGVICGNGGLYRFNLIGSRPRGIILYRCRDVRLENFTIRDPASWSCYLKECDGVRVKGLRIDSHANMNNDGLDIESCNVSVEGCDIDSGDDGICLKSDNPNYLVTNVVVRDCVVRTPCTALKLGTASHGGFKDIRFEHCRVARARRAIRMPCADAAFWGVERMKSYPGYVYEGGATPPVPGIGIENVDGGSFAGIRFSDIDIEETLVPLFVRMGERRKRSFESSQIAIPFGAHPSLEDVRIENVTARSVAATASAITGVPGFRPQNIVLRNVSCRIKGGGAASEASRPVPEKAGAYPDPNMFDCQILPAYGLYVRHADGIRLENVRFACDNPQEGRPERVTDDAEVSAVPAWPRERLFQVPRTYPSETFRTNDVTGTFFEGLPYLGKPTRVFCYYGVPKRTAGEKVPGMVLVHGGGGSAFYRWVKFWNDRGYAAISMDTCGCVSGNVIGREQHGHPRHAQGGPAGWGGFEQMGEDMRDQWLYHAVADVVLGHSLLRSLEGVDADRIGLTGVSWGGVISCIVASLDGRLKFAAPVYGCGGFMANSPMWSDVVRKLGPERTARWIAQWDPIRYLPDVRIPIHWLAGTNDKAFSIPALMDSFDAVSAEKSLSVKVRLPHKHNAVSEEAVELTTWADCHLRGVPLPTPVRAELNYTKDSSAEWIDRTWETAPAKIAAGQPTADIPAEATAWYFNVCSSNGFVRSTPVRTRMRFQSACPVWPQGAEKEMNTFFRFRGEFESAPGAKALLRITAGYDYKAWLDGAFVAFGPARTAPGFFRVDEWPLKPTPGANVLEIDVAGYNCNNFYLPDQTPFLQAEVIVDGQVVARTAGDGNLRAFTTGRLQKVPRFSYQRTFAEIYRLPHAAKGIPALAEQPAKKLLPREWAAPDFKVTEAFAPQSFEKVAWDRSICPKSDRYIVPQQANYKHFKVEELEENPYYDIQRLKTVARTAAPAAKGGWHPLADGEGLVFAGEFEAAGFPLLKVRCAKPVTIYLTFDELLQADGSVDPFRAETLGTLVWHLAPGEHELEGFEPIALKAARILAVGGAAEVTAPRVRTYASPLAARASFRSSDPALEKIFDAARRSYAANAVDCLADCPIRERAGWLGDTFFTGRASKWLTGSAKNEQLFLNNFLLPDRFDAEPVYEGLVPAVWPADLMTKDCFIPNYDFWLVLELEELVRRGGDRRLVRAFKPRVLGIAEWFGRHCNADGLLEKLPGWVFVEWSKANDLVQDVNYPSNMMYAKMLDAVARMYGMPEFAVRAAKVRETVRKQSLTADGWYCDNAVRQADGTLKLSGERTEICQYYAFFCGVADKTRDALLWKRLVEDFGPERIRDGKWKEIWPANFIFGTCLRMELLSQDGRGAQIYRELRDYFLAMAEKTGTLWEHNDPRASCCHGFASIASEYLIRDVLGFKGLDADGRPILRKPKGLGLDWCEATLPVSATKTVRLRWER